MLFDDVSWWSFVRYERGTFIPRDEELDGPPLDKDGLYRPRYAHHSRKTTFEGVSYLRKNLYFLLFIGKSAVLGIWPFLGFLSAMRTGHKPIRNLSVSTSWWLLTQIKDELVQAYFLGIFKKLKAQKTQPLKKLKAIFCRKTQYVGIF